MVGSKVKTHESGILYKISMGTVAVSFASLLLMMLWGTADVVFIGFGYPVPGTLHYTEVLNVIALFLPLMYVTSKRSHIVVDIITYKGRTKRITDFIADLLVFLFSIFFAWQLGVLAWESLRIGEFDMIGIKVYLFPAKIALAFGAIGSTVVALLQVIGNFRKGKRN